MNDGRYAHASTSDNDMIDDADDLLAAEEAEARRVRQLRERHWTMLALAAAIALASSLLHVGDESHVSVLGRQGLTLPPMCGSRILFGIDCPGCGLTRSFVALAHGDVAGSFHFHHLGWLVALAVLAQFPYRTYKLRELRTSVVERRWPAWFGQTLIALLIINWLAKMAGIW